MRLGIMQPYLFPHLGYFQLVNAVDKFIFYDDVNFIKNGWINRNRILINGTPKYLTVKIQNASSNRLICETLIHDNRLKLKTKIELAYKEAPFFKNVWPLILDFLNLETFRICELSIYSVKLVSSFLELETTFERSSISYSTTRRAGREERLIEICRTNNATHYFNPIGGASLYSKEKFSQNGILLNYIKPEPIYYKQFSDRFVPGLSVIDVMMFNDAGRIRKMLSDYKVL
jgi:hypothetical protein